MIGVLLFAAIWGDTVSIENPGIRLELFLKELSQKSGQGFHCPTALNNEVLAVAFNDRPLEDIKAQLARVIHGTWEQKPDGWWLVQTGEQKNEEVRWNLEIRQQFIKKQLEILSTKAPTKAWDVKEAYQYWKDVADSKRRTGEGVWNAAQRRMLRYRTPRYRLEQRLGSLLNANMFSGDGLTNDYRKYSWTALPGHIQIPINPESAIADFRSEQNMIDDFNRKEETAGSTYDSREKRDTPRHLVASIIKGEIPYITMELLNDKFVETDFLIPGIDSLSEYLRNIRTESEALALSKDTIEIEDILSNLYLAQEDEDDEDLKKMVQSPLYKQAVDTMLHARTQDPLGIVRGRCWIDYAHQTKKPMIANLSDDDGLRALQSSIPKSTITLPNIGMTRIESEEWVLARPVNPLFNRTWRLDRGCIEGMADIIFKNQHLQLEGRIRLEGLRCQAEYSACNVPGDELLIDRIPNLVLGLLNGLSDTQKKICESGGTIPLTSISGQYQKYAYHLLMIGYIGVSNDGNYNPVYTHAVFPNGISNLRLGYDVKGTLSYDLRKPDDEQYSSEEILKAVKLGGFPANAKVRWKNCREINLKIGTRDNISANDWSERIGPQEPFSPWSSVSEPIRKQILAKVKEDYDDPYLSQK